MLAEAKTLELRRGDVLFEEGAEPDHLYVVEDGRIAMASKSDDGRESVFALMERGDLFGEMPLLDGLGRSAEARALEPSTVDRDPLRAGAGGVRGAPRAAVGRGASCCPLRLRNMDAALADSVFLDVTGRTAKRLLDMADGEDEFTLPVTQEELAGMVGASRERVNKAIASFVRLGWIDQTERRYTILDREQLTRRARGSGPRYGARGRRSLAASASAASSRHGAARPALVVVDEAVVGALVADHGDAGGLGGLDVGGRGPLVDGADDRHGRGRHRRRVTASSGSIVSLALPVLGHLEHPVEAHRARWKRPVPAAL